MNSAPDHPSPDDLLLAIAVIAKIREKFPQSAAARLLENAVHDKYGTRALFYSRLDNARGWLEACR